MGKGITKLIVNNPYVQPTNHWLYDVHKRTWRLEGGRRQAGYVTASEASKTFDDPGVFRPLPLVNRIRDEVDAWRQAGYPGVTSITKRLLEHWQDRSQRTFPFFFCQLEAVETLIWLTEAPAPNKVGIDIPRDGGEFLRRCCKMATGTGKTLVMGLVIAWHVLNKVTYPQDTRFSKHVFIVAPGLTVKNRLSVLKPGGESSVYEEFAIVPTGLRDKLQQGKVVIKNWHILQSNDDPGPAVVKLGKESDEAFCRRVLDEIGRYEKILVLNDEAHHAWRVSPKTTTQGESAEFKEEADRATKWIGGLDRIHKRRGILACYDFTATPFAPTGKRSTEETLFGWVVSDFGLNDAIESGLVKTPRLVIRDDGVPDAKTYKSKLYHIYNDDAVKEDLNRKKAQPAEPMADLVQTAYLLLTKDWAETRDAWKAEGHPTPPVMISIANHTETAARVKYGLSKGLLGVPDMGPEDGILHIDSKILKAAESREAPDVEEGSDEELEDVDFEKMPAKQREDFLRRIVDTVGKQGKPGANIYSVVSVNMLSEGWDCRTVTHIMGLRAFTSQLLCEQVIGRGLRRVSYEVDESTCVIDPETGEPDLTSGMFQPEYVNVFGVPFTFLPHEGGDDSPPPPPTPTTLIQPELEKAKYELRWPNIVRIESGIRQNLTLEGSKIPKLKLDTEGVRMVAEVGPLMDHRVSPDHAQQIRLEDLAQTKFRYQRLIFEAAKKAHDQLKHKWPGNPAVNMAQLVRLVEQFMTSDRFDYGQLTLYDDELRRRVAVGLNANRIVLHIVNHIKAEASEFIEPIFNEDHPEGSTSDMRPWGTRKPTQPAKKSHINRAVMDSTWEDAEAFALDDMKEVEAWAKNDHLGFEIPYIHNGEQHRYFPDFLIRLKNGTHLVLEVKGTKRSRDETKWHFMDEWIRAANAHGGFGRWAFEVSAAPGDVRTIVRRHA